MKNMWRIFEIETNIKVVFMLYDCYIYVYVSECDNCGINCYIENHENIDILNEGILLQKLLSVKHTK